MKLDPPADLSISSFEQACEKMGIDMTFDAGVLVCPESLRRIAEEIEETYDTPIHVLPTELFANEFVWAVINNSTGAVVTSCPIP